MTSTEQKTHVRVAETGMALCVALGVLAVFFIAAMTNLNRLIGISAGLAPAAPASVMTICLMTIVPLVAFYLAFARTAGRLGAPRRLRRHEAYLYFALIGLVLMASLARAWTVGLETILMAVTLPPVLLFMALRQNRAARGMAAPAAA